MLLEILNCFLILFSNHGNFDSVSVIRNVQWFQFLHMNNKDYFQYFSSKGGG